MEDESIRLPVFLRMTLALQNALALTVKPSR